MLQKQAKTHSLDGAEKDEQSSLRFNSMLPKNRRISRKEFPYILTKGKRYNSPNFLLYVARDEGLNKETPSRFSFSVSKKVCKNAADRNRQRRRGYSVVSHLIKNTKPGFLCFFSFKKGSGGSSFINLEKEVPELLSLSSVLI